MKSTFTNPFASNPLALVTVIAAAGTKVSYPKTTNELKKLILKTIKEKGNNADLNFIDTSNITDMTTLFAYSDFNGDISKWNVSNVQSMVSMFSNSKFNGDISKWNVSKVQTMHSMFNESVFNKNIAKWNTSKVKVMEGMFQYSQFNKDISKWNTSNVTNMKSMFGGSKFNKDISNWDASRVKDMKFMFTKSKFTGDISGWKTTKKNLKSAPIANLILSSTSKVVLAGVVKHSLRIVKSNAAGGNFRAQVQIDDYNNIFLTHKQALMRLFTWADKQDIMTIEYVSTNNTTVYIGLLDMDDYGVTANTPNEVLKKTDVRELVADLMKYIGRIKKQKASASESATSNKKASTKVSFPPGTDILNRAVLMCNRLPKFKVFIQKKYPELNFTSFPELRKSASKHFKLPEDFFKNSRRKNKGMTELVNDIIRFKQ